MTYNLLNIFASKFTNVLENNINFFISLKSSKGQLGHKRANESIYHSSRINTERVSTSLYFFIMSLFTSCDVCPYRANYPYHFTTFDAVLT